MGGGYLSVCLVSTGSGLKNKNCYSVNCQLGQASMLGDNKGALILIMQR